MNNISPEISSAIDEVLAEADTASQIFKGRLRQLIVNAMVGNLADSDVTDVVSLAPTKYPEGV